MTIELYALDQFEQIGRLTDYLRVEIIERDLAEGAWLVELPLNDVGSAGAALLAATWPGIEAYDPDTGWRFGGYLTSYTVLVDEDGTTTLRLAGSDFQSDLANWLEWPESSTPDEWWANTYGGTLPLTSDIRNAVWLHAGEGNGWGRNRIAGLVRGPDPQGGEPKNRRIKGEPLLAVAKFLLWGTDWTCRLHLVRDDLGAPSMLFETIARPTATVTLDVKAGAVGRLAHGVTAGRASWVLAMGAEVEPVVTPGERYTAITQALTIDWRYRHREAFISRPSTDETAALGDEAFGEYTAGQWSRFAQVDSARVSGYGRDIDLGWYATVALGASFTPSSVTLPVVASKLSFTAADGWVRTVDLGTESLSGPGAVYSSMARSRAAIRQIENDLR